MKPVSVVIVASALLLASCSNDGASSNSANENVVSETAGADAATSAAGGAAVSSAQVMTNLFQSSDLNRNGFLTREEVVAFVNLSLISQDTDEDGRLSLKEFQSWDVGFDAIAAANGATDRYQAAKAKLFEAWDSNGDGYVVLAEYDAGIGRDFASVPKQDEKHLTAEELTSVPFIAGLAAATQ